MFFSGSVDDSDLPHPTPIHLVPPPCMLASSIRSLKDGFNCSVVREDNYELPVVKVTEVGDGSDYGQCFEFPDPVVPL